MIANLSVLAIIPARGGSKGLPGKNLRPLAGLPLIAWSIAAARACPAIDDVIVSTDDPAIAAAARAAGARVPFLRPAELATDSARTIDVVHHALGALPQPPDLLVLLQPTSPLRQAEDITAALTRCIDAGADTCVSVTPSAKSPAWMYQIDPAGRMRPLLEDRPTGRRRQDLPPVYVLNGAVYVARTPWLLAHDGFIAPNGVASVMPPERSVDIDTLLDFRLAELLMAGGPAGTGQPESEIHPSETTA